MTCTQISHSSGTAAIWIHPGVKAEGMVSAKALRQGTYLAGVTNGKEADTAGLEDEVTGPR